MSKSLEDLPDDVLLLILSGAGAQACGRLATCCKRLRDLVTACSEGHSIFSSAISERQSLLIAVQEATGKALAGITGTAVSFAIIFVSGHYAREHHVVLPELRRLLPKETGVLGCVVDGLLGLDSNRHGIEKDPSSRGRDKEAVSVLLGRVAGSHACLFVDDCIATGLDPDEVFQRWVSAGLPQTPQPPAQAPQHTSTLPGHRPKRSLTAARKIKAGSSTTITTNVGTTSNKVMQPAGPKSASSVPPPCCVWLFGRGMLYRDESHKCSQLLAWINRQWQRQVIVAGGLSSGQGSLFFSPGATQAARIPQFTAQSLRHAHFAGIAFCPQQTAAEPTTPAPPTTHIMAGPSSAARSNPPPSAPSGSLPAASNEVHSTHVACAVPRAPTVQAAALTYLGLGAPEAEMYRVASLDTQEAEGLLRVSLKLLPRAGPQNPTAFLEALEKVPSKCQHCKALALWPADEARDIPGGHCTLELLQSGKALILDDGFDLTAILEDGCISCFADRETDDIDLLFHLMKSRHTSEIHAQLISLNSSACRAQLPKELQFLQRACGGENNNRDASHYYHARMGAQASGACSAPQALVAFSCIARGEQVFGGGPSEAEIVADATQGSAAFIGGRMAGEIGPKKLGRNGAMGWNFKESAMSNLTSLLDRKVELREAAMESYTTVYAALGS